MELDESSSLMSFVTVDFDEEIDKKRYDAIGRKFDMSNLNKIMHDKPKIQLNSSCNAIVLSVEKF